MRLISVCIATSPTELARISHVQTAPAIAVYISMTVSDSAVNERKDSYMTKTELAQKAIDFAMSALCDGYLDMPSGCEGCPLWDPDDLDDDGNSNCRDVMLKEFLEMCPDEFVSGEWIEKTAADGHKYFECSVCGAHENKHTAIKGGYCWRCGTPMNGGVRYEAG